MTFVREDLTRQHYVSHAVAIGSKDSTRLKNVGLVLVRQKPGFAKGVMFITLEDETGLANLVIWPKLYEQQRRTILTASMLGVEGRIQREGEVVHLVAFKLHDLTPDLSSLGARGSAFPLPQGRGDEFSRGPSAPDPRDDPQKGVKVRDIYGPDLHLDTLKQKSRDFQ